MADQLVVDRLVRVIRVLALERQKRGVRVVHRSDVHAVFVVPAHVVVSEHDVAVGGDDVEDVKQVVRPVGCDLEEIHGRGFAVREVVEYDGVRAVVLLVEGIRQRKIQIVILVKDVLHAVCRRAVRPGRAGGTGAALPLAALDEAAAEQLAQLVEHEAVLAGIGELCRDHVLRAEAGIGERHGSVLDDLRRHPVVSHRENRIVRAVFHEGLEFFDVPVGIVLELHGTGRGAALVGENDALILECLLLRELSGIEDQAVGDLHEIGGVVVVVVVAVLCVRFLQAGGRHRRRGHGGRLPDGFGLLVRGIVFALRPDGLIARRHIDHDFFGRRDRGVGGVPGLAGDDGRGGIPGG